MKKKITSSQIWVIELMSKGWELGVYKRDYFRTAGKGYTLQEGGLGKGGKTNKVHPKTFDALIAMKIIEQLDSTAYNPKRYVLSEMGKTFDL